MFSFDSLFPIICRVLVTAEAPRQVKMAMFPALTVPVAITLAFFSSLATAQACPCIPYGGDVNYMVCADQSLTFIPDCVPSTTPIISIDTPTIPLVPETLQRFTNLYGVSVAFIDKPMISNNFLLYQSNLEQFQVWETGLDYVDNRWFVYTPGLKLIKLIANKILTLAENTFSNLPMLYYVDLRNNLLTTLPTNLFEGTSLQEIYLDGNPWQCDCEMMRFLQWLWDHNVTLEPNATCWQPMELRGLDLLSLTEAIACSH